MLDLIKIKYRDDVKIFKFCELAKILYKEFYSSLISEKETKNLIYFLQEKIIKNEIKENQYEYYLISTPSEYIGIIEAVKCNDDIINIYKIFILKQYENKKTYNELINKIIIFFKKQNFKQIKTFIPKNNILNNIFQNNNFKHIQEAARYLGNDVYIYENIYILNI